MTEMLWEEWQHADLSQPNRIGQANHGTASRQIAKFGRVFLGADSRSDMVGTRAVFADGSVHLLKARIGIRVFARLVTRAGGEVVSASDY
jgi:hypothetical protein